MATLIENVNSVKAAFSDIKAAIAEKGVEVADGTPVTEYASLIASISGGAENRTKYKYYRWTVTDFRRSGSQLQFANICELKLYDINGKDCCTQEGAEYTASSHDETTGETVDKAFDGDVSTRWHSDYTNSPSYTNWIKVHLPTAVRALSLGLTTRSDWTFDDHPEAFMLEGSNDDETYTTLFSITGCSDGWTRGVERVFSFDKG